MAISPLQGLRSAESVSLLANKTADYANYNTTMPQFLASILNGYVGVTQSHQKNVGLWNTLNYGFDKLMNPNKVCIACRPSTAITRWQRVNCRPSNRKQCADIDRRNDTICKYGGLSWTASLQSRLCRRSAFVNDLIDRLARMTLDSVRPNSMSCSFGASIGVGPEGRIRQEHSQMRNRSGN